MFWIIFKLNSDLIGAKIEGDKATVYWNTAPPREKKLQREYTYQEIATMHPANIRQGIMMVAGMADIRDLRITNEDINWLTYLKANR
jgi:hypothetical protein